MKTIYQLHTVEEDGKRKVFVPFGHKKYYLSDDEVMQAFQIRDQHDNLIWLIQLDLSKKPRFLFVR